MPKFNHAFDVGFEVISADEDGRDITSAMFEEALIKRARQLTAEDDWRNAASRFDTYEVGE